MELNLLKIYKIPQNIPNRSFWILLQYLTASVFTLFYFLFWIFKSTIANVHLQGMYKIPTQTQGFYGY